MAISPILSPAVSINVDTHIDTYEKKIYRLESARITTTILTLLSIKSGIIALYLIGMVAIILISASISYIKTQRRESSLPNLFVQKKISELKYLFPDCKEFYYSFEHTGTTRSFPEIGDAIKITVPQKIAINCATILHPNDGFIPMTLEDTSISSFYFPLKEGVASTYLKAPPEANIIDRMAQAATVAYSREMRGSTSGYALQVPPAGGENLIDVYVQEKMVEHYINSLYWQPMQGWHSNLSAASDLAKQIIKMRKALPKKDDLFLFPGKLNSHYKIFIGVPHGRKKACADILASGEITHNIVHLTSDY